MSKPILRPAAFQQALLILCTGIGAAALFVAVSLTLLPMLLALGLLGAWIVAALLIGWGGIEAMAALERWLERDPRFQR